MLSDLISTEYIIFDMQSTEKEESFAELLEMLVLQKKDLDRDLIMEALIKREDKMSTAVLPHIAVPHAVSSSVEKALIGIGISRKGIPFESEEGEDNIVNVIFVMIFSEEDSQSHLHILRDILTVTSNPEFYQKIMNANNPQEIVDIICSFEN